jgi:uncharacterized protein
MARMAEFVRRHVVLAYLALTFAISWGGILVVAGPDGIPLPVTSDPLEASPFLYIAMLAGPAVAGIAMTGVAQGRAGLRALLARLVRWRVGVRWFGLALLTAPLVTAAAGGVLAFHFHTSDLLPAVIMREDRSALLLSTLGLGLTVGLFEELGWTGFATPMLRRTHGVLATGLLLGLVWGAWHFLLFWQSDSFAGAFPLGLLLIKLFSFLAAYRVLMVWVHERTGSLLIAILMHAALIVGLQPGIVAPVHVIAFNLLFAAALWGVIGVLAAGGKFSQRAAPRPALERG